MLLTFCDIYHPQASDSNVAIKIPRIRNYPLNWSYKATCGKELWDWQIGWGCIFCHNLSRQSFLNQVIVMLKQTYASLTMAYIANSRFLPIFQDLNLALRCHSFDNIYATPINVCTGTSSLSLRHVSKFKKCSYKAAWCAVKAHTWR